jgi:hypothetical protein
MDVMKMGQDALKFLNSPTGRQIQRTVFGLLKKRR